MASDLKTNRPALVPGLRLYWLLIGMVLWNFSSLLILSGSFLILIMLWFFRSQASRGPFHSMLWPLGYSLYSSLFVLLSSQDIGASFAALLLCIDRLLALMLFFSPFSRETFGEALEWLFRPLPTKISVPVDLFLKELAGFLANLGPRFKAYCLVLDRRGIWVTKQPWEWLKRLTLSFLGVYISEVATRSQLLTSNATRQNKSRKSRSHQKTAPLIAIQLIGSILTTLAWILSLILIPICRNLP